MELKNEWQPYPKKRKMIDRGNYVLVIPESFSFEQKRMPVFCEVCSIRFGHIEDEKTYKKFGCCSACADTWAYSHKEKWESGWRPSQEQIKISVDKRSIANSDIVFE